MCRLCRYLHRACVHFLMCRYIYNTHEIACGYISRNATACVGNISWYVCAGCVVTYTEHVHIFWNVCIGNEIAYTYLSPQCYLHIHIKRWGYVLWRWRHSPHIHIKKSEMICIGCAYDDAHSLRVLFGTRNSKKHNSLHIHLEMKCYVYIHIKNVIYTYIHFWNGMSTYISKMNFWNVMSTYISKMSYIHT